MRVYIQYMPIVESKGYNRTPGKTKSKHCGLISGKTCVESALQMSEYYKNIFKASNISNELLNWNLHYFLNLSDNKNFLCQVAFAARRAVSKRL